MKFIKKTKAAVIGISGVTYMTLCCLTMPTPAVANTINGILEFTTISGSPTPTGTFSYDTISNGTNFIINWDGASFNFYLEYVTPEILGFGGSWGGSATYYPIADDAKDLGQPAGTGYANSQDLTFSLTFAEGVDAPPGIGITIFDVRKFYHVPPPFVDASGNFTVAAPTPAPEPATVLLLGTGLVGLAAVRKKKTA